METVIVAFENGTMAQRFGELLENTGTAKCLLCRSGDQVRRLMNKQTVYCVVCGPHLSDGPAEWLAEDLPPACSLLLVGPQHMLDACASRDVYTLATPIRREEAVSTVKLLLQFGHRMERFTAARRSGTYGNYLRISHPGGQETVYAHMQYLYVRAGEVVQAGQSLGTVGQTGRATGAHLHFEFLTGGIRYDPSAALSLP